MTDQIQPPMEPAPAAPTAAPAAAPAEPAPASNLPVGLAAGVGLGLVAVLIYAGVAWLSDREFGYIAFLIGFGVAFGLVKFGRRASVMHGAIAAVISAALFILALFLTATLALMKIYEASFGDSLNAVMQVPGELLSEYFKDPMSWLFLVLAVIPSFITASGLRNRNG
jgi:hypothetical protein